MGNSLSDVWEQGYPDLHPCLARLQGWSREDIKVACLQFRSSPALAIDIGLFMRGLGYTQRKDAEPAFDLLKNNKNKVEWYGVIAAMILMSNQKYISKVTFLFSLTDFNGSGTVNCAELCIGMRYLFLGISRFFQNATVPPRSDVEKAAVDVFAKIDIDNSYAITIDEVVTYAYMAKGLRLLLSPFPATDTRLFEDLIIFNRSEQQQTRQTDTILDKQENRLVDDNRMTSTAKTRKRASIQTRRCQQREERSTAWKENSLVTKAFSWLIYKISVHLQNASTHTVSSQALLDLVSEHETVRQLVHKLSEKKDASMNRLQCEGDLKDISLVANRAVKALTEREFVTRLQDHAGDAISLRALFCLTCPLAKEAEIQDGVGWCKKYRVYDALEELLRQKVSTLSDPNFDQQKDGVEMNIFEKDVDELFEVLDTNHDGRISIDNLIGEGNLSATQAQQLVTLWDKDRSGELSRGDLLATVQHVTPQVAHSLKGLFSQSAR